MSKKKRKRRKKTKSKFSQRQKEAIKLRDGNRWVLTGRRKALTIHHIRPRYAGGSSNMSNGITLTEDIHQWVEKHWELWLPIFQMWIEDGTTKYGGWWYVLVITYIYCRFRSNVYVYLLLYCDYRNDPVITKRRVRAKKIRLRRSSTTLRFTQ